MSKTLKMHDYLNCSYGRSLNEAAEEFGCCHKTVQRRIKRIPVEYPGVEIEHLWDDEGTKRFRAYEASAFISRRSFGKKDILSLWSLMLAVDLLRNRGLHDDAQALDRLAASLIQNAPLAHRTEINGQLELLRVSENIQTADAGNRPAVGIASKLRLAVLQKRQVTVTTANGGQWSGRVAGLNLADEIGARLKAEDGAEIDVPIAEIKAVVGVDDLIHAALARAA
jgi:hypothetical protein